MPLYIRDDSVDALANELQRLTRARSKTDAVRAALEREIARVQVKVPLAEKIRQAQEMVRRIGDPDPRADMTTSPEDGGTRLDVCRRIRACGDPP